LEKKSLLSKRGENMALKPSRVDLELYWKALADPFEPDANTQGHFTMNVAENHLCWYMLRQKIEAVTSSQSIPEWAASYGDPAGVASFREAAAAFLSEHLLGQELPAETIAFSVGATATIEMTAFLLADHGDTAVIPAPAYPVYSMDIGALPGVQRFDLHTHHEIQDLKGGIPLTVDQLEAAKQEISAKGSRFRMLILTSPDNPTGAIYTESQLVAISNWCEANEVHLIVNEIYGLARIDLSHPAIQEDYPDPIQYVSFGRIMARKKSPYLHLWYAFSKDLGISGFRIGMTHTYNMDFLAGYRNVGLSHAISNYTQWVMQEVLKDKKFMSSYIKASQQALTQAYVTVVKKLKSLHIPYNPSYGSLFVWMDLSSLLDADSDQGQERLWMEIFDKTKILLTPGAGFGHSKKGLFRMVISSISPQALEVAMERLGDFILQKRDS
jgi:aspartate/methionine/tyrosine aminotransferase